MRDLNQMEIKAEEEMLRRWNPAHWWYRIPPVYTSGFDFYLRWVLARIPRPEPGLPFPPPLGKTGFDSLYVQTGNNFGKYPVELYDVKRFLEELLGEQLEAALGRKADADDYQYVADVLVGETETLNPMPATVIRAFEWPNGQLERCKRITSIPQETNTDNLAALDATDTCADGRASVSIAPGAPLTDTSLDKLLQDYSLAELNNLLRLVGLLATIEPLAVAETKPAQWVALVTALNNKKKLVTRNRVKLHGAFTATYGLGISSLRSFQESHNENNDEARVCYEQAVSQIR